METGEASMSPDDPMARAMPAALEPLAGKLAKKLRKARQGDPEAVHDARSLLRRLRVGLDVMGRTVFEAKRTGPVADGLRDVERALGPKRDDDVFLEHLDRWIAGLGVDAKASPVAEERAGLKPLRDRIAHRRSKHARTLEDDLGRKRTRKAMGALAALLEHPERATRQAPRNPTRKARSRVRDFVHDEVWRAFEEAAAFDARDLSAEPDVEVVHKFRSACRRLRFTLEIFEGALHEPEAVVGPLHALQDRLGDLHDHAVAAARIEDWMRRSRIPSTASARRYLDERLRAEGARLAELPDERASVTGEGMRGALYRTLHGETPRPAGRTLRLVPAA
jgi:CHAD domain-containing protein